MYKYKFRIFTSTYNREDKLYRVFKCLVNQTYIDFEWLMVDDRGKDNTKEIIENWKEKIFTSISYLFYMIDLHERGLNLFFEARK